MRTVRKRSIGSQLGNLMGCFGGEKERSFTQSLSCTLSHAGAVENRRGRIHTHTHTSPFVVSRLPQHNPELESVCFSAVLFYQWQMSAAASRVNYFIKKSRV